MVAKASDEANECCPGWILKRTQASISPSSGLRNDFQSAGGGTDDEKNLLT